MSHRLYLPFIIIIFKNGTYKVPSVNFSLCSLPFTLSPHHPHPKISLSLSLSISILLSSFISSLCFLSLPFSECSLCPALHLSMPFLSLLHSIYCSSLSLYPGPSQYMNMFLNLFTHLQSLTTMTFMTQHTRIPCSTAPPWPLCSRSRSQVARQNRSPPTWRLFASQLFHKVRSCSLELQAPLSTYSTCISHLANATHVHHVHVCFKHPLLFVDIFNDIFNYIFS